MPRSRARQWADLLADTPVALDASNRLTVGDAATASATLDVATDSGDASVEIQAPASSSSILKFGDTLDDNVGHLTYNHASDYLSFTVNASEAMRIDSDGNVGIGTAAPLTELVTVGTSMATSQSFVGSVSDTTYSGGIINLSNTSRSIGITADPNNSGASSILTFSVDGAEAMRIDSSGNVGIGTTSPTTSLEINAANTLGATFTGTTAGEGVEVSQTSYTADNYVSLIEGKYLASQAAPHVRIGAQYTGGGSKLVFGTSNSYGSGITNSALTIDPSGDITTSGSITPGSYNTGQVIEELHAVCNTTSLHGRATIQNVTNYQAIGESYGDAGGSVVTSYTPPSGTKMIVYEYTAHLTWRDAHAISHWRLYYQVSGGSWVEVTKARTNRNGYYPEDKQILRWVFEVGAASDDSTLGIFNAATPQLGFKWQVRDYGTSNERGYLHYTQYWDGAGTDVYSQPMIMIKAIA